MPRFITIGMARRDRARKRREMEGLGMAVSTCFYQDGFITSIPGEFSSSCTYDWMLIGLLDAPGITPLLFFSRDLCVFGSFSDGFARYTPKPINMHDSNPPSPILTDPQYSQAQQV